MLQVVETCAKIPQHTAQQCQAPYLNLQWSKWVGKKFLRKNLCCWLTFVLWSILISEIQEFFHFLREVRSWTLRCHCEKDLWLLLYHVRKLLPVPFNCHQVVPRGFWNGMTIAIGPINEASALKSWISQTRDVSKWCLFGPPPGHLFNGTLIFSCRNSNFWRMLQFSIVKATLHSPRSVCFSVCH